MNKVILIGNLTRDPEKRQTQDGRSVCNFTLAVNKRTRSDHPEADYFRVTTWDQTADNCAKFLAKGRKAYVDGPVHLEQYTDRDGVIRYNLKVDARAVEFLTPRTSSGADAPPSQDTSSVGEADTFPSRGRHDGEGLPVDESGYVQVPDDEVPEF